VINKQEREFQFNFLLCEVNTYVHLVLINNKVVGIVFYKFFQNDKSE
jgi:hypothetical protein